MIFKEERRRELPNLISIWFEILSNVFGKSQKMFFLMAFPLRRGGGGKGRAIKKKITFSTASLSATMENLSFLMDINQEHS